MAAPAIEPINVCDELDGIPKYQVTKFQVIAESKAAKITIEPISGASAVDKANGSTMSDAIAFATPTNVIAPKKFIIAAIMTATRGGNARVETEVAIAFAVSWKPLIKSKANAHITTNTVIIKSVFNIRTPKYYALRIMIVSIVLATVWQ